MSKRKWRDRAQAAASAVADFIAPASEVSVPPIMALDEDAVIVLPPSSDEAKAALAAEMAEPNADPVGALTIDNPRPWLTAAEVREREDQRPAGRCSRHLVFVDATHWQCACGARGPSGRTADGVPYNDETTMAHEPGEPRG